MVTETLLRRAIRPIGGSPGNSPLGERVADDRDRRRARPPFLVGREPAAFDARVEDVEVVAHDELDGDAAAIAIGNRQADLHRHGNHACHALECGGPPADGLHLIE
jgi:hypothetical protein